MGGGRKGGSRFAKGTTRISVAQMERGDGKRFQLILRARSSHGSSLIVAFTRTDFFAGPFVENIELSFEKRSKREKDTKKEQKKKKEKKNEKGFKRPIYMHCILVLSTLYALHCQL